MGDMLERTHDAEPEEQEDQARLMTGTKAVAVSTNKPLTSKFRGVCWNRKNKRWQVAINSAGKYLYLGSYDTQEEAAKIFDKAAVRVRGAKARLNFRPQNYVDELGNVIPDAVVDQLLAEAQNPDRPRRARALHHGKEDGAQAGLPAKEVSPRPDAPLNLDPPPVGQGEGGSELRHPPATHARPPITCAAGSTWGAAGLGGEWGSAAWSLPLGPPPLLARPPVCGAGGEQPSTGAGLWRAPTAPAPMSPPGGPRQEGLGHAAVAANNQEQPHLPTSAQLPLQAAQTPRVGPYTAPGALPPSLQALLSSIQLQQPAAAAVLGLGGKWHGPELPTTTGLGAVLGQGLGLGDGPKTGPGPGLLEPAPHPLLPPCPPPQHPAPAIHKPSISQLRGPMGLSALLAAAAGDVTSAEPLTQRLGQQQEEGAGQLGPGVGTGVDWGHMGHMGMAGVGRCDPQQQGARPSPSPAPPQQPQVVAPGQGREGGGEGNQDDPGPVFSAASPSACSSPAAPPAEAPHQGGPLAPSAAAAAGRGDVGPGTPGAPAAPATSPAPVAAANAGVAVDASAAANTAAAAAAAATNTSPAHPAPAATTGQPTSVAAPASTKPLFQAIAQALPPGAALSCILPGDSDEMLGVLYGSASAPDKSGGGIWDGRVLRNLGLFDSDRDAKQAVCGTMAIMADLLGGGSRKLVPTPPPHHHRHHHSTPTPPPCSANPAAGQSTGEAGAGMQGGGVGDGYGSRSPVVGAKRRRASGDDAGAPLRPSPQPQQPQQPLQPLQPQQPQQQPVVQEATPDPTQAPIFTPHPPTHAPEPPLPTNNQPVVYQQLLQAPPLVHNQQLLFNLQMEPPPNSQALLNPGLHLHHTLQPPNPSALWAQPTLALPLGSSLHSAQQGPPVAGASAGGTAGTQLQFLHLLQPPLGSTHPAFGDSPPVSTPNSHSPPQLGSGSMALCFGGGESQGGGGWQGLGAAPQIWGLPVMQGDVFGGAGGMGWGLAAAPAGGRAQGVAVGGWPHASCMEPDPPMPDDAMHGALTQPSSMPLAVAAQEVTGESRMGAPLEVSCGSQGRSLGRPHRAKRTQTAGSGSGSGSLAAWEQVEGGDGSGVAGPGSSNSGPRGAAGGKPKMTAQFAALTGLADLDVQGALHLFFSHQAKKQLEGGGC